MNVDDDRSDRGYLISKDLGLGERVRRSKDVSKKFPLSFEMKESFVEEIESASDEVDPCRLSIDSAVL